MSVMYIRKLTVNYDAKEIEVLRVKSYKLVMGSDLTNLSELPD